MFCSTEWFQQQQECTNEIENMEIDEMIKCLAKFYVSVRKTGSSYYKKTSLLSIRAALDRHLWITFFGQRPFNSVNQLIIQRKFYAMVVLAVLVQNIVKDRHKWTVRKCNIAGTKSYVSPFFHIVQTILKIIPRFSRTNKRHRRLWHMKF